MDVEILGRQLLFGERKTLEWWHYWERRQLKISLLERQDNMNQETKAPPVKRNCTSKGGLTIAVQHREDK